MVRDEETRWEVGTAGPEQLIGVHHLPAGMILSSHSFGLQRKTWPSCDISNVLDDKVGLLFPMTQSVFTSNKPLIDPSRALESSSRPVTNF